MFERAKAFYQKHRVQILVIGGGAVIATAGILLGKKAFENKRPSPKKIFLNDVEYNQLLQWEKDESTCKYLESIGGEIIDGTCHATKEVATRFMEEQGQGYQLDILSPKESVIWIQRNVEE
jgi:hypothetical protein